MRLRLQMNCRKYRRLALGATTLLLWHDGIAAVLKWEPGAGSRSAEVNVSQPGRAGFTRLDNTQTGVAFTNHLADGKAAENQIRLIGSGVALGDIDGDGWCDIYLCRLEGSNRLYRNLGNWTFQDVTAPAGVACGEQYSTGVTLADLDGDNDLDLLVNALGGGTRCFLNDGRGRYAESPAGLMKKFCGTTLALADIDGDGDLDLYCANYRTTTIRSTGLTVLNVGGKRMLRPEDREQYEFTPEGLILEHGEPDILYLNDGRARFTPVPWGSGMFLDEDGKALVKAPKDWGLSAMFRDMNGDRAPDLYVCNDFWSPDRIWINDGAGRFRALPRLALRNSSTFSMGVDFADIDRDGDDDFLVLDMLSRDHQRRMRQRAMSGQNFNNIGKIDDRPQTERNTLYLNRGDHTYTEIAQLSGVQASEWSWGAAFIDVDLDGLEDVLITTGHGFDTQDSDAETRAAALGPVSPAKLGEKLLLYPRLYVPNVAFRNRGDLTFEECGARWGFDTVGVSHGIALGDLDNDGDFDVVVNNLNSAAGIYRNESDAPRVAVRLKGKSPNTRGIGAKIRLLGGPVTQSQEIIAGGRYLSSDDALRVFSSGQITNGLSLAVTWRNGLRSVLTNVQPNRIYEIDEGGATSSSNPSLAPRPSPLAWFTDVSLVLNHTHHENPFDDFARQPLLSRRLSQLGPGLCWYDFDRDGRDDLLIGAGRGGELALLRNRGNGRFEPFKASAVFGKAADDLAGLVAWADGAGGATLWVVQSNYEAGGPRESALRRYEIRADRVDLKESLPGSESSSGPVAAGDIDGDGDLDLFVGGRVVAGRYPEPATSHLYRRDGDKLQLAVEWRALGLVSGAVFSDLIGDSLPELILACEWGPIRIFRNERGNLTDWNAPVASPLSPGPSPLASLADLTGWWNGVTTGDFDNDGRLDLIAANWGRNTPHHQFVKDEVRVHFGDFSGRGNVNVIEANYDARYRRVVPWRDPETVSAAIPWLRERFPTALGYSEASLDQIFGNHLQQGSELRVRWLDTTLFLNRGDRFEARSLPVEAQFAPAFAVCVGDYDGDGNEDLFLGQNFFAVEDSTSRYDGGRGLWLKGDGQGNLQPVPGQESGVLVYGEQRGAAVSDYDADGRVDLVVSQNAAATKLFHNDRAKPGLRVRLKGPSGNPDGAGAVVRLGHGQQIGPAREVHLGSGYWSQDGAVQVLGYSDPPAHLFVRWPGQTEVKIPLPAEINEITVDHTGKLVSGE